MQELNVIMTAVVILALAMAAAVWQSPRAALRLAEVLVARAKALNAARQVYAARWEHWRTEARKSWE